MAFPRVPVEIIALVAQELAADLPVPRQFIDPRLLQNRKGWMASQRALRSLCLVSTKCAKGTQPALYQHIALSNFRSLALLYRTILDNPQMANHIEQFNFEIELPLHSGIPQDTMDPSILKPSQMLALYQEEHDSEYHRLNPLGMTPGLEYRLLDLVLIKVLTQTVRLKNLTLRVPSVWYSDRGDLDMSTDHHTYELRLNPNIFALFFHHMDLSTSSGTGMKPILSELSAVHLLGHPQSRLAPYEARLWHHFQHAGNLKTIKSSRDNGEWRSKSKDPQYTPILSQRLTLTLSDQTLVALEQRWSWNCLRALAGSRISLTSVIHFLRFSI